MATLNNPLAPGAVTNIDGPDVYPPIEPETNEDLGGPVPLGEEGNVEEENPSGDDATNPD